MATYKFETLNDASADKAIKSIRTKGAALRKLIHETAVGLILHMEEHGRHTKFIALADAIADTLGKNQRKAFIEWVLAFTWLTWDDEQKVFAKDKDKENKIEEAKVTPFWDLEREVEVKPFDIQKAIVDLLKRARTAAENGKLKGPETMIEHLDTAFKSFKVEAPKAELVKKQEPAE